MASREELQTLLENLLGSNSVYFQPPSTVTMTYPAIVYERNTAQTKFADNNPYSSVVRYTVTLIDKNPDSSVLAKIMLLPMCTMNRHFTSNNLNHDVFDLYY